MGIVNCTPDSVYNNLGNQALVSLLDFVEKMIEEGADIIDIGGYSTRPGAETVAEAEECRRILPLLEKIHQKHPDLIVSVDTFRPKVARLAIEAGASMLNDISGGREKELFSICAEYRVPYILMHIQGEPHNMMENTDYKHLVADVYRYFTEKIREIHAAGVNDVLIDPGFGFSKDLEQNYQLMRHLDYFKNLNLPLLVGISRKSMLKKVLDIDTGEALNGTTVLNTYALTKGANILRVHDVKEAVEVKKIYRVVSNS